MNNKAKVLLSISLLVIFFMIGKAFILNEDVKFYLITFFFVGLGLGLLRLFVNGMIKKMKGKHIGIKILFFAVLLSIGLPFQNWFRKDILLEMSMTYLIPSIIVAVSSMIFMTVVYGLIYERKRVPYLSDSNKKSN